MMDTEIVGAGVFWSPQRSTKTPIMRSPCRGRDSFCFKHGAYAGLSKEAVEAVGFFGRREVDAMADGGRSLWNGSKYGARVLEDRNADENERTSEIRRAGSGDDGFKIEPLDGSELDRLDNLDVKIVERLLGKAFLWKEMWGVAMKRMGLGKKGIVCKREFLKKFVGVLLVCWGISGLWC